MDASFLRIPHLLLPFQISVYPTTFLFITFYAPLSRCKVSITFSSVIYSFIGSIHQLCSCNVCVFLVVNGYIPISGFISLNARKKIRLRSAAQNSQSIDTREAQRNKPEPFAITSQVWASSSPCLNMIDLGR